MPIFPPRYLDFSLSVKAVIAEFMALAIFVFVGTLRLPRDPL